jgi:hypothetical protein
MKCERCGQQVSPGICAPGPHVFHDRPEHCIEDLRREVLRLRDELAKERRSHNDAFDNPIFED